MSGTEYTISRTPDKPANYEVSCSWTDGYVAFSDLDEALEYLRYCIESDNE